MSLLQASQKRCSHLVLLCALLQDIKSSNVLLSQSLDYAKLGDFGVALPRSDSQASMTFARGGTNLWLAPECLKPGRVNPFWVDVWALGCLMLEAVTGHGYLRMISLP
jgi:serine/threonine protein kinase